MPISLFLKNFDPLGVHFNYCGGGREGRGWWWLFSILPVNVKILHEINHHI